MAGPNSLGTHLCTGVEELLQRFLQLYAARALVSPSAANSGEAALNAILAADPARWPQVIM